MEKIYYKDIDKLFLIHFKRKVESAKRIIITTHKGPDDDAIASILSIYYYITNIIDKPAEMKITGTGSDRWKNFENFEKINFLEDLYDEVNEEDLIILLDGSKWVRFSNKKEMIDFKGETICMDHHPNGGNSFNLTIVAPQYTSTAEIVYRTFYQKEELSPEIAEILLMGIIGDTGNFTYINDKTASVLSIAEKLIKISGVDVQQFKASYSKFKSESYELLKEFMKRSKTENIGDWPGFIYTSITLKIAEKYSAEIISEASSMFRYYLTNLEGVSWGFIVTPGDKGSKISFRSIPGSVNVRELTESMNIGGGHNNASGGFIEGEPDKAVKTILKYIKKNEPKIQKNI